jgi:small subunit ribosomal protein S4
MGRYIGPSCKICRKVSTKLFLKGERCFTPKCAIEKQRPIPGASQLRRRRLTDYGVHLREKQKLRFTFGLMEKQFAGYVKKAFKDKLITSKALLQFLERRLDNVVFKLNFSHSRKQARQIVGHGHFTVNDVPTNIPSFQVKIGDVIKWKSSKKDKEFVKILTEELHSRDIPDWLELDPDELEGKVTDLPEINEEELDLETRLIVEHYSR